MEIRELNWTGASYDNNSFDKGIGWWTSGHGVDRR